MAQRYNPPKQSKSGQIIDVIVVLGLVFLALFLPLWLEIAVPSRVEKLPAGVSYTMQTPRAHTWTGPSTLRRLILFDSVLPAVISAMAQAPLP